ncbi:MAG: hypothetical protein Q8K47_01800 [Nitrosomonas sp.]|nr:hypothetical protein [Nitrosomonas sp.]
MRPGVLICNGYPFQEAAMLLCAGIQEFTALMAYRMNGIVNHGRAL